VGALNYTGIPVPQYEHTTVLLGDMGVASFFVLSGFLMVRQTDGMFGRGLSPFVFAYRRIIRIVPLYWIATIAWLKCIGLMHLGDASYGTYLSHLWVLGPVILYVQDKLNRLHVASPSSLIYVVACVIAANVAGLAIHWAIERPMTRALQHVKFGRARGWLQRRLEEPNLGG